MAGVYPPPLVPLVPFTPLVIVALDPSEHVIFAPPLVCVTEHEVLMALLLPPEQAKALNATTSPSANKYVFFIVTPFSVATSLLL